MEYAKYNIGDKVYYFYENYPQCGVIEEIEVTQQMSLKIVVTYKVRLNQIDDLYGVKSNIIDWKYEKDLYDSLDSIKAESDRRFERLIDVIQSNKELYKVENEV